MVRVLVVDDDSLIRESLKLILGSFEGIEVVDVAANGKECIDKVKNCEVDVVLLDMRMPIMTGVEVLKYFKAQGLPLKTLVLTTFDEDELIAGALEHGAAGYILKNSTPDKIAQAIRSVAVGHGVFETEIIQRMGDQSKEQGKDQRKDLTQYGLSKRELEMVELVAEGLSNKEIAEKLYISEGTVKNYITSVLGKMDLKHRTQIAITYIKS
ncbi:MAG: response regulator [Cellulosilyticaceae bacterium]